MRTKWLVKLWEGRWRRKPVPRSPGAGYTGNPEDTPMRITRRLILAGLAAPSLAHAQAQDWPARSVRVVVPWPAGGGADTVSRILFARVSEDLRQAFVIENRGGASGTIGAAAVATAPADGYTVLYDATAFSVNPFLMASLPYDPLRAFQPVFLAGRVANLLLANNAVAARTVPEVIAEARAARGGLAWASSGNGSVQHLALEMFARAADIQVNHIPYRGGGPALNDLIAGQVRYYFSNASASIGHVRGGTVRAIAHTGSTPLPSLPGLPRVADTLPGFEAYEWNGVFLAAGVPAPVVQRLNAALSAAVEHPAVKERLAGLAVQAQPNTPEEFGAYVRSEMEKWGRLVREARITAD